MQPIRVVRTNTGTYLKSFQDEGMVGIDFNVDEDLGGITSSEEMRRAYLRWNPDDGPNGPIARGVSPTHSAGINTGCLWRFLDEPTVGETVIVPDGYDWLVGEITGDYYFRPGIAPRHCRSVRWHGHVPGAQLAADTKQALTSWLAYFSVWPGQMGYDDLAAAVATMQGGSLVVTPAPAATAPTTTGLEPRVQRLERIVAALLEEAKSMGAVAARFA